MSIELLELADQLDSATTDFQAQHKGVLEALTDAATEVHKSWSGSNLGYHALVYCQRPLPDGRGLRNGKFREPILTSTRRKTLIRSTLNHALKTNPGMLPQSRALEDSPADTPGQARNGADRDAGGQVVRGETGFGRRHRGSASDPESGVSRVFVLDRCGAPLMPCHPARARKLLKKGRAVVVRLPSLHHPAPGPGLAETRSKSRSGSIPARRPPAWRWCGRTARSCSWPRSTHRGARIGKAMQQRSGLPAAPALGQPALPEEAF